MSDNYWDATIEAYDGFITKPKLEGKHLKRPPFLYLMHIYIETMKASKGFGRGLFSEEELSRAYYDPKKSPDVPKKEIGKRKFIFFQKLIVLVSKMLGEPKAANPKMIIVGKECEKTNLFLQQLAKVAKSGKDDKPYCEKIMEALNKKKGGNEKPKEKPVERKPERDEEERRPREPSPVVEEKKGDPSSRFRRGVEDQVNQEGKLEKKEKKDGGGGLRMGNLRRRKSNGPKKGKGQNNNNRRRREEKDEKEDQRKATTIEGLKEIIQKATQSTNPLGKIIEFVDDDIESMSKEYQNWYRVYVNSKSKLEDQEKKIDEQLQTYKDKIMVKEEQIREKKGQIQSLKTQILRNNEKIQRLLQGIVGD